MVRKISGGKYRKSKKKKKYERSGKTNYVSLGKERKRRVRTMGGYIKIILLSTDRANLKEKNGKIKPVKIKSISQIPSNRYLKGILFKGAIIETDAGKARITNRPTQEGVVNAVLI